MSFMSEKSKMIKAENALPGRESAMPISAIHTLTANKMSPPFPEGYQQAMFGLGCFWGAERKFWSLPGVYATAVGYSAGFTPNPTYQEVCSGSTGHNEAVMVIFDPSIIGYNELLKVFWESHNTTQGMRQGTDAGTQYRSGIYSFSDEQHQLAEQSRQQYQKAIAEQGFDDITTEIKPASAFYYAEEYHQQYLDKNPNGYCGLGGCRVKLD